MMTTASSGTRQQTQQRQTVSKLTCGFLETARKFKRVIAAEVDPRPLAGEVGARIGGFVEAEDLHSG